MSAFKNVLNVVNRLYSGKHLFVTNTISCGVLMGLGDISMQKVEKYYSKGNEPHNWGRTGIYTKCTILMMYIMQCYWCTGRMFCMGLAMGPATHAWYTALDRFLPGVTASTVVKKILLDQVVASPFFNCFFFMGMGFQEGHGAKESWEEFTSKFWDVYKVRNCVLDMMKQ